MKRHFQRVIWPLTVAASLFGFALIEYPQGKPRRLLSLFYAIVMSGLQVSLYFVKELWFRFPDAIFIHSVGKFMMICCCLSSLMSICLTHWYAKRYDRCLGAIDEIDETLRNLGIETNYSKLRRAVVIGLITWAVWCCLLNTFDTAVIATDGMQLGYSIIYPLLFDTQLHLPILVGMHFWCVVGYAGTRFDCISNALKNLAFDDNDFVGWLRNDWMTPVPAVFVPDEKNKRTIWIMMHLHFHLCQTLRNMHHVFEAQISLHMNFCSVYILCSVIYTFRMILLPFEGNKIYTAVVIWIWTVAFFINIVVINQICESVRAKATSIGHTTAKLLRLMDDKEMCKDIFSSMVTILVIILQLKTGLQT